MGGNLSMLLKKVIQFGTGIRWALQKDNLLSLSRALLTIVSTHIVKRNSQHAVGCIPNVSKGSTLLRRGANLLSRRVYIVRVFSVTSSGLDFG